MIQPLLCAAYNVCLACCRLLCRNTMYCSRAASWHRRTEHHNITQDPRHQVCTVSNHNYKDIICDIRNTRQQKATTKRPTTPTMTRNITPLPSFHSMGLDTFKVPKDLFRKNRENLISRLQETVSDGTKENDGDFMVYLEGGASSTRLIQIMNQSLGRSLTFIICLV